MGLINPPGSSNSFETINAPAGTDPVADSATDTLNLTSSDSKILITGTASTDTLDVTAPTLVVGPSSATDTAVAVYDGTTGKLVKNTGVTINGSNNILTSGTVTGSNLTGTNSGDVSLSAFGSTPGANGASLSGQALTLQPADATNPGGVSTGTQTFAGVKTFSSAPNLSSLTASLPLKLDGSKNITAAAISLSGSEVTNTLPESKGGTNQSTYTTGDTVYSSATNTLSKLAIGSEGQVSRVMSGIPAWTDDVDLSNFTTDPYSDFITGTLTGLTSFNSGTGSGVSIDTAQTAANPGVYKMVTGTDTTGLANISGNVSSPNVLFIGGGLTVFETIIKLSALSDGTNTYTVAVGVSGTQASVLPANCIQWRYTHGTNSGNWTLVSVKASSATSVDSGVPATTNFTRLSWVLNSAGTSIQGYVNGVASGSAITTNIPVLGTTLDWVIVKSAGTTSRTLSLDAYKFWVKLLVPR